MEKVFLRTVGEAQTEFGRRAQSRVEGTDILRRVGCRCGSIANVNTHGVRITTDAVTIAVADETVVGGRIAVVGTETALGVPHVETPTALRRTLARRHPVVVGPVPHRGVSVYHHIVGDVVDIDALLSHGVVGGHRQIAGAQKSEGAVPMNRVTAGEGSHLHHIPECGAAMLLLHEGFTQMFAEVVVTLPHAVDVERDKGAARALLAGSDEDAPHQLVLDERIGDVVFSGA